LHDVAHGDDEVAAARIALRRILVERARKGRPRDVHPGIRPTVHRRRIPLEMGVAQSLEVVDRPERRASRQAAVERSGERVLVGCRRHALGEPLLGRGVRGRQPDGDAELGQRRARGDPGQPEVGEVRVLLDGSGDQQDVLRLDVPVHDVASMRPVEGPRDLADDVQRDLRLEAPLLLEQGGEVGVAQRRRQVQVAARRAVLPHGQHMRMRGPLGGERLALEALAEDLVRRQAAIDHLHRRRSVVPQVGRLEDAPHAALPDLGQQLEAVRDHVAESESALHRSTSSAMTVSSASSTGTSAYAPRCGGASPGRSSSVTRNSEPPMRSRSPARRATGSPIRLSLTQVPFSDP
jgi:hypothetical protein